MPEKLTLMKVVRERRGISLGTVAAALGVGRSHLSRVERCETQASPDLADKMARYFRNEITRDQILFPDDYPVAAQDAPAPLLEQKAS